MASLETRLRAINMTRLVDKNKKTVADIIESQIKDLKMCINDRLQEYMRLHPPKRYKRTGGLESSLSNLDDVLDVRYEYGALIVEFDFGDSAYHPSGFGVWNKSDSGEKVNTGWLLNYGYSVTEDVWFKDIPNFGQRDPAGFVELGIMDFKSHNPYNMRVYVWPRVN